MSFGTHITKYALFGLFLLLDGIVSATVPTTVISVSGLTAYVFLGKKQDKVVVIEFTC